MALTDRPVVESFVTSEAKDGGDAPAGRMFTNLLAWAYRRSVGLSFAQLVGLIVLAAVVLAVGLAIPIWRGLYGVPAGQVAVVTVTVALFTATPLACFLVYVIKKAENTRTALESSNRVLTKEREAQAQTLLDLRRARDEARAANQAKTQFLANMSHELRTPLNAVIGFSEVIAQEMLGTAGKREYVEYAKSINESGAHLLALINDILDVSRIEAGGYRLDEEIVEPASLVGSALRLIESRAGEAEVLLRNEICEGLPALYCDVRAVKQMLLNLLSNAVSFTPSGGRVALSAQQLPLGGLAMKVSDTGVGMSESEIPYALGRFSQVDNSHARGHQGAGLGLSLTQDLIALHGGALEIESQPGRGTTVTLTFPPERTRGKQPSSSP